MTQNNEKIWLPMTDAKIASGMTQEQLGTCCDRGYLEYRRVGTGRRRQIERESLKKFCVEDNPFYNPKNEAYLDVLYSNDSITATPQQQKNESIDSSTTLNNDQVAELITKNDQDSLSDTYLVLIVLHSAGTTFEVRDLKVVRAGED